MQITWNHCLKIHLGSSAIHQRQNQSKDQNDESNKNKIAPITIIRKSNWKCAQAGIVWSCNINQTAAAALQKPHNAKH